MFVVFEVIRLLVGKVLFGVGSSVSRLVVVDQSFCFKGWGGKLMLAPSALIHEEISQVLCASHRLEGMVQSLR